MMLPAAVVHGPSAGDGSAFGTVLYWLFHQGLRILAVIVGLALVQQVVYFLIRRVARFVKREAGPERPDVKKRADTISSLLKSVANVALGGLGILFVLQILGIDVGPFLAGAGILGVALGFGSQSVVKDCLAGLFILAENQASVGDVVSIAGVQGTVERVTVRSITLRDYEGRLHYVPNGEIRVVTNLSQGAARFVIDVPMPAGADGARALTALNEAMRVFASDPTSRGKLLEAPEVLGFESLGAGQNVVRVTMRALRQDQHLARAMRAACMAALARVGIPAGGTSAAVSEPLGLRNAAGPANPAGPQT
jgi:small conductance mechanosensitive channel